MNSTDGSQSMFNEGYKPLRTLLTIPVTSSSAESIFSTLRGIKTFLTTMTQLHLNTVIRIKLITLI